MTDQVRDALQDALGGDYAIDREISGGGMSRVFVATETALGRKVVIKVLPGEMAGHVSAGRFKREIALAAHLQHPHIVPLLTAGEVGTLPYFTMPFIRGESLRARLAKEGELPVADAVRILREVASALEYAHEAGVVHRDIKPDNVLLSGGSAMVTDFGVAKALTASATEGEGQITSLGVAIGTPVYMAPEQASADPTVDHRADVYALGVLAYEVLTGAPPFAGRSAAALLAAHVTEAPEPASKRRAFDSAGARCSRDALSGEAARRSATERGRGRSGARSGYNARRWKCARELRLRREPALGGRTLGFARRRDGGGRRGLGLRMAAPAPRIG